MFLLKIVKQLAGREKHPVANFFQIDGEDIVVTKTILSQDKQFIGTRYLHGCQ